MSITYSLSELKIAVGDYLELGRSGWSADDTSRIVEIIKSALSQVYYPTTEKGTYQWSWMRPISELTTNAPYDTGTIEVVSGVVTLSGGTFPAWAAQGEIVIAGGTYDVDTRDSDTQVTLINTDVDRDSGTPYTLACYQYDLPDDFGGFEGDQMTYTPGQAELYPAVTVTSDRIIRKKRQHYTERCRPRLVSYTPKTLVAATGQRYEAQFYPTPNAAYTLHYKYKVIPDMLSNDAHFPHGGPAVGELILQACLSVAEQRHNDEVRIHTNEFNKRLTAAISDDAESFSPDTLGYNSDNSDRVMRDPHDQVAVHSFEGTYYYDKNP